MRKLFGFSQKVIDRTCKIHQKCPSTTRCAVQQAAICGDDNCRGKNMPTIMGNIEALFKGINQGIHKQMMKQTVKKSPVTSQRHFTQKMEPQWMPNRDQTHSTAIGKTCDAPDLPRPASCNRRVCAAALDPSRSTNAMLNLEASYWSNQNISPICHLYRNY